MVKSDPRFCLTQNFWIQDFFGPKIFMKFLTPHFFGLKIFLDPKCTWKWSLTMALTQIVFFFRFNDATIWVDKTNKYTETQIYRDLVILKEADIEVNPCNGESLESILSPPLSTPTNHLFKKKLCFLAEIHYWGK